MGINPSFVQSLRFIPNRVLETIGVLWFDYSGISENRVSDLIIYSFCDTEF